jgi:hypothetical protein
MLRIKTWLGWLGATILLLAGCTLAPAPATLPPPGAASTPASTGQVAAASRPAAQTTAQLATGADGVAGQLAAGLLYPRPNSELTLGQPVKFIASAKDAQGRPVADAVVTITVRDAGGKLLAALPTTPSPEGAYRAAWVIPHRVTPGTWHVAVAALRGEARAAADGTFEVQNSTSETLLNKYGFWLDPPALNSIVPSLYAERGDAANGMIQWGGQALSQHVFPENWVEVFWRTGDFGLDSPAAVRHFMLAEVGNLGWAPVRDIGPFERTQFKSWPAWRVGGRSEYYYQSVQWLAFYAPEVNKTYLLETMVVLPPPGIDPHATLRAGFGVHPEVHAAGVAPEPWPRLLPGPELAGPPLGADFTGLGQPIVLRWQPVKELAPDEYYQVAVGFNYKEGTPRRVYTTRDTQFTLPETLYYTPNCNIFNWQVTLMRQTRTGDAGQRTGVPISYDSLYWYVRWSHPLDQPPPFIQACPNPQT